MKLTDNYFDSDWNKVNEFVLYKFHFDPEKIFNDGLDDNFSDKEFIEYLNHFVEDYEIEFKNGEISHKKITLNDRIRELVYYYDELPDAHDKEFDTLDEAMDILRELRKEIDG